MQQFTSLMLGIGAATVLMGLAGCSTTDSGDRSAGRIVDDKQITENVENRLQTEPVYKFNDVQVQTFNGAVQLSGFVTTEDQRQRAAQIAQRVDGVTQVFNSIALKPQSLSPTGRTEPPIEGQPLQVRPTGVQNDVNTYNTNNLYNTTTNAPPQ